MRQDEEKPVTREGVVSVGGIARVSVPSRRRGGRQEGRQGRQVFHDRRAGHHLRALPDGRARQPARLKLLRHRSSLYVLRRLCPRNRPPLLGLRRKSRRARRGGVPHGEAAEHQCFHRRERSHRSEERTSELQPLMRTSYAVFSFKKNKLTTNTYNN